MLGPRGVRLPALWALETVSMIVIRLLRSDLDPKNPMCFLIEKSEVDGLSVFAKFSRVVIDLHPYREVVASLWCDIEAT